MSSNTDGDLDLSELSSALPAGCTITKSATGICLSLLSEPLKNTSSAEQRTGVVDAWSSVLEEKPDVLETLAPKVRKRVECLRVLQSTHDKLKANYFREKAALAATYQKRYEPLYEMRYKVVSGLVEVVVSDEQKEGALTEDASKGAVKGVPEFWLTAMKANEILNQEEHDEGALKFLKDIKWCRINDPAGFKLEFLFDRNIYFRNSVLTKTYHMIYDGDEPVLEQAIGTSIKWFPGKCLTTKAVKRKPWRTARNTNTKKFEKRESFFNFFNPPVLPTKVDDLDDDTADHLQNLMEHDYEVGATIRDQIIPKAVLWFTGEAAREDDCEDENDHDSTVEIEVELEGEKSVKRHLNRR